MIDYTIVVSVGIGVVTGVIVLSLLEKIFYRFKYWRQSQKEKNSSKSNKTSG